MENCNIPIRFGEQFGLVPNDTSDQTTKLQEAINSFRGEIGRLWLRAGVYYFQQLMWKRGVSIEGVGPGTSAPHLGTQLIQIDGVNDDAIIADQGLPLTEFMHWSRLHNIAILKITNALDTEGSGLRLDRRTGEHFSVGRVTLSRFPKDGVRVGNGGTPAYFRNLNVSGNKQYGINVQPLPGMTSRHHGISFENISGDSNGIALMNFEGIGTTGESFTVRNVKSETVKGGFQQQVFRLKNINHLGITFDNVVALAFGAGIGTDMPIVRIEEGFSGTVNLVNVGYENMTHAIIRSGGPNVRIGINTLRGNRGLRYTPSEAYSTF